jgi:hypothetical protein
MVPDETRAEMGAETGAGTGNVGQAGPAPARAELVFDAVLVVAVGALLVQAFALPFLEDATIGSGFLPVTFGVVLLVLLLARIAVVLRALRTEHATAGSPVVVSRQLLLIGVTAASAVLCALVGVLPAVGVLLAAALLAVDRVRPQAALVVTAGTLLIAYLLFDVWLRMDLGPSGLF